MCREGFEPLSNAKTSTNYDLEISLFVAAVEKENYSMRVVSTAT